MGKVNGCSRIVHEVTHNQDKGRSMPTYKEAYAEYVRRANACINACAGIPTEALESGVIGEMKAVLEEAESHSRKHLPVLKATWIKMNRVLSKLKG